MESSPVSTQIPPIELPASSPQYYVLRNGVQEGPYDLAALRQQLESRTLSYRDLVWTDGLESWEPVSDVLGADPKIASPNQSAAASSRANGDSDMTNHNEVPKVGRWRFGRLYFGISFLAFLMVAGSESFGWIGAVGAPIVAFFRLRDAGWRGWAAFLPTVFAIVTGLVAGPSGNFEGSPKIATAIVMLLLHLKILELLTWGTFVFGITFPRYYVKERKLDKAGIITASISLILIFLWLLSMWMPIH